ncbi:MAG: phosphoadenosine phosphosulfate reductase family protein, partial [Candidatus Omnitrophica bacterium]|nr:phosphoadenosine phosphosulfate reductase family protein [Candidatus Omnitrophota bacterium]
MEKFEPKKFISEKIKSLRASIGEKKAIVAVSGGIDSLVCFEISRLATKTKNSQIIPFILDTGLLRENEVKKTQEYFQKRYGIELQMWDRQNEFFAALRGIISPEQKRAIFRDVFYRTMSQAVRSYDADILVQGTILPDIIETQKGIKT